MKHVKIFIFYLLVLSISFAEEKNNENYLSFSQSDNNFAIGILAEWANGSGFGVPLVYDRGACGGMFSFGGEMRFWWDKYSSHSFKYSSKELTKFGFAPNFRFMFHPFGMPVLDRQVIVAKVLDPYAGFKFGFSLINYDKNDPRYINDSHRKYDFHPVFTWFATGIRWYFKENIALWTEISNYNFSLGFNFKF
ncbi:MAG: hypothetical protein LBH98_00795 [Chitinispirillales bacterium]|jgi:hypothetical protein|nr:hypothetical protein [Chitinispirillales bacterium]